MRIKKFLKNALEIFLVCVLYPLLTISLISVVEITTGISFIVLSFPTVFAIFMMMLLYNNTRK